MIYEKYVPRHSTKSLIRLRQLPKTNEPAYGIVNGKEADYRDLKRVYERMMSRDEREKLADEIGLKVLIDG